MTHPEDTPSRRLEALRDLLGDPPSPSTWAALVARFDAWAQAPDLATLIDYAAEHLSAWPPELRRDPPLSWYRDTMRTGRLDPKLRLVNALPLGVDANLPRTSFDRTGDLVLDGLDALSYGGPLRFDHLDLHHQGLEVRHLPRLAEMVGRYGVTRLNLRGNPIGQQGLEVMASEEAFEGLVALNVARIQPHFRAALEFPAWDLPHLRRLDVSGNWVAAVGWQTLLERVGWSAEGLELRVRRNHLILDQGALTRGRLPASTYGAPFARLTGVVALDHGGSYMLGTRFRHLCGAPGFGRLRRLDLSGAALRGEDLPALVDAEPTALTALSLGDNLLGDAGATHLAALAALAPLEHLSVAHSGVGDEGARALLSATWPDLASLDLSNRPTAGVADVLDPNAIEYALDALDAGRLPALRTLDLRYNHLGEGAVRRILEQPSITRPLLDGNPLPPAAIDALAEAEHLDADLRRRWQRRRRSSAYHPDWRDHWNL